MVSWVLLRGWLFSAWTTPATWAVDQLVTASDLNTHLRDNLNALKTPPSAHYECNEGSDYALTSTSFANVDGTHLSLTITTTGGDVFVGFHGNVVNDGSDHLLMLDVTVDGTPHAGDDGLVDLSSTPGRPVCFMRLIAGLSAGSHTFNLTYKVSAATVTLLAGAGTSAGDLHPQFWVREMS
jgi:hypothetical protein